MRGDSVASLASEVGLLKQLIAELGDDDYLERLGLEHRLKEAQERLEEVKSTPQPSPLVMTFRGKPVEGSKSIEATFAGKALTAFVDATKMVTASLVVENLRDQGPIPITGDRSLRVVDSAVGSFGFELELPPPAPTEDQMDLAFSAEDDPYAKAIDTTLRLLSEAATDDEDAISDLVAETHPRAAAKVCAFASLLADNDALLAVDFGSRRLRFDSPDQVKRVVESLAASDISEEPETYAGVILGVLPESRRFEARVAEKGVIQGKVGLEVADLLAFKQQWEGKAASLHFRVVRVRSRERFVLTGAEAPPAPAAGAAPAPDSPTG